MKSTNTIGRIAATLLCLVVFASASFAATNPLSYPQGLAVDAKGNLYVANNDANNILIFSPGYALQKSDTITQNINFPTAVAIDPLGNLWVANAGPSNGGTYGSIAEYIGRQQYLPATITNGIVSPLAMAIDGIGDVWVENDFNSITVYASPSPAFPPNALAQTLFVNPPVFGLAVAEDVFAYGNNNGTLLVALEPVLASNDQKGEGFSTLTGVALASAPGGNFYVGNSDGTVDLVAVNGSVSEFLTLPFVPSGIAVDNVRGRVYISNAPGNSISVYSTAGTLLHTIE
ncbi:MAG: hypothetical protein ABSD75_14460 [Terriglobales bacterium]|jgi:DNA-binding beta-propeller fold protein YncE